MADYANIRLERDGAVTRLVLSRPERRNALTHAMMLELEDAFVGNAYTDPAAPHVLRIAVDYRISATNDRRNLVFPFYSIPED